MPLKFIGLQVPASGGACRRCGDECNKHAQTRISFTFFSHFSCGCGETS
ncbi:four-helix bundle copper-binding protein [Pseudomonas brassicacearum]